MDSYRREQTDPRSIQVNQGIVEATVDDLIYRPRFPCTALFPDAASGAAYGAVAGSSSLHIAYPNAGSPTARMSWPVPSALWLRGTLSVRIVWSGDTASAVTDVVWRCNFAITALNGVPTGITGPQVAVAGPSVIGAIQNRVFTAEQAGFFPIDSSAIHLGLAVVRDAGAAADTYAGEARLHSFQLIYTPVAGH